MPVHSCGNLDRMVRLVEEYWDLNRTAVNSDTDQLVRYLAKSLDADVLEVSSGEEVLTWRVPKRWDVHHGQLRTTDGEVLADFKDNPLHLWTHSCSKQGEVSRQELIENHVYTDPNRPEEIPYHYRNGFRYDAKEWGFSLPYTVVDSMDDETYVVDIDTELDDNGTLKVVDAYLPGELDDTVLIAAHTCHPAQVSDGLANVAIGVELYHLLKERDDRRWSYRFLFGPEYFAGAAWLDRADSRKVTDIRYGIYLDFLSSHEPIGFQHSMQEDTRLDRIVHNVLSNHAETFIEKSYRELVGNDETFYNGPGFEIPMVGFARAMHREYHYSSDNPENMDTYHMRESLWILQRIIEAFESDVVPEVEFDGPLYLSRYDLYIDPSENPDAAQNLEKIHVLADGSRSCLTIADELEIDYFEVLDHFKELSEKALASLERRDHRSEDVGRIGGGEKG